MKRSRRPSSSYYATRPTSVLARSNSFGPWGFCRNACLSKATKSHTTIASISVHRLALASLNIPHMVTAMDSRSVCLATPAVRWNSRCLCLKNSPSLTLDVKKSKTSVVATTTRTCSLASIIDYMVRIEARSISRARQVLSLTTKSALTQRTQPAVVAHPSRHDVCGRRSGPANHPPGTLPSGARLRARQVHYRVGRFCLSSAYQASSSTAATMARSSCKHQILLERTTWSTF